MRLLTVIFCALFLLPSLARADQFEDGIAAYKNKDYAAALRLWLPLAKEGNAEAQDSVGLIYEIGDVIGLKTDDVEAVKWYRKAAEQGYAKAQSDLAGMYGAGWGVKRDEKESMKWERKAAEGGFVPAQFFIGMELIEKDSKEGIKWWIKAAEGGYAPAEPYLGRIYERGEGVKQDYAEAMKWFRKAEDTQDIAEMYRKGEGVKQDYAEAYFWWSLSPNTRFGIGPGYTDAANHLTLEQKATVDRRVAEWKKAHPAPEVEKP